MLTSLLFPLGGHPSSEHNSQSDSREAEDDRQYGIGWGITGATGEGQTCQPQVDT
jgi:hypothetical protein